MWAPIDGATVGGSSSPRSELREVLDPGNGSVTWNGAGSSVLDALVKVTQVPSDGIVIVGQVHGYGSPPLIMIYYRYDHAAGTGRVIAKLQETPVQGPPYSNHTLATDVDLGETFSYQLKVQNNRAMASVNGHTPVSMAMSPAWDGETFYFKAGAYLHMHGSSTEGGRVKFYRLAASHPNDGLRIDSPAARAGSTYQARLSSTGGLGGSSWKLVSGHPPAGLRLEPDGLVTGTPAAKAVSDRAHWFTAQVATPMAVPTPRHSPWSYAWPPSDAMPARGSTRPRHCAYLRRLASALANVARTVPGAYVLRGKHG